MAEDEVDALDGDAATDVSGDTQGFDAFVTEVEGRVRRALIPVAGVEAARDATTDALVHAWGQWSRVRAMENAAGYVYTVARSRVRLPRPADGPLPETVVDPAVFPEVEPRLASLLAALPERQRVAVYLLHGCGWSTPEVAALLDVSVSTVRNHVARRLDRLRRELGAEPPSLPDLAEGRCPMTNDDLERGLRGWADATDPASGPIGGDEVRAAASDASAIATGSPDHRPRRARWIAVAAALVLVVGGLAWWSLDEKGDGTEKVATDPTPPDPAPGEGDPDLVPTQIVIDAPELYEGQRGRPHHRIVVARSSGDADPVEAGDPYVADRLWPGTSLVLNRLLPPGPLHVRYESYAECAGDVCPPEGKDGRPEGLATGEARGRCDTVIEATASPTRALVRLGYDAAGEPTCEGGLVDTFPSLTVPPDWTVREDLPWTCGTGAAGAGGLIWSDPEAVRDAFACLVEKYEAGEPVELRSSEIGPTDDARIAMYRVVPDGDGVAMELLRSPFLMTGAMQGWSTQRCSGLTFSDELLETPQFTGCGSEDTMSLDIPDLATPDDDPGPSTTHTLRRLVVDAADLPSGEEGTIHRWVLRVGGDEVGSGRVDVGVALVVDDEKALASGEVEVAWEQYDCPGSCPTVGPDGKPLGDDEPFEVCSTKPSALDQDDEVLVLRLRAGTCSVSPETNVPDLTVPPAWTLREPLPSACGSDPTASLADPLYPGAPSPSRAPRECLVRVLDDGESAELSSAERIDDASRPIVYRVGPDGIDLIRPPRVGDEAWTRQHCNGLEAPGEPPWIVPTGCGPETPMSLDPP